MKTILFLIAFFLFVYVSTAPAQTVPITFQGKLDVGSLPANGNYDIDFGFYSAETGGVFLYSWSTFSNVVINGIYSATANVPASIFNGEPRYVAIAVKPSSGGTWTVLSPRQRLTHTPHAIHSINATMLGGVAANQYLTTTTGNATYIQNTTTQQSANFNISGNGTIGGNFGVGTANPASKLHVSGNGVIRVNADSDWNAGLGLSLNNQTKWSVATVSPGQFQIFNEGLGSNALWIDNATNNVGIGSTSPAATLEVNGYTKLGSDAPAIRVKKLVGTTSSGPFCQVVPHGLDNPKILAVSVMVNSGSSQWISPSNVVVPGCHFAWHLDSSFIHVCNVSNQSASILSKPIKILITYEQ